MRARISPRGVDLLGWCIGQQRGAQPRARPGVAEGNLHRFQIEVGSHVHHRPHAFGHKIRHEAPGFVERDQRDIQAEIRTLLHLVIELRLVFRAAGDLETAGLDKDHRLAGFDLKVDDLLDAPRGNARHCRVGTELAAQAGGARGALRGELRFVEKRHGQPGLGQVKGGRGAQGAGADHNGVGPFGN
jgi:hypothetical protein